MGVITTGQSFLSGQQVTAQKLEDIASNATFTSAIATTDNSTLTLGSGKLKVADTGITATQLATDSVITTKIQNGAVTAAKLDSAAVSVLMPTGSIIPYAGQTAPSADWLLCDGAAIARQASNSNTPLFTLLGETYGAGDGSSTFNIPDLRGRVIAGQDDMGGASANRLTGQSGGVNGDNLGASGGTEGVTLTAAESGLPAHNHTQGVQTTGGNIENFAGGTPAGLYTTTGTVSAQNASSAHNNVQPTFILNYIIKT